MRRLDLFELELEACYRMDLWGNPNVSLSCLIRVARVLGIEINYGMIETTGELPLIPACWTDVQPSGEVAAQLRQELPTEAGAKIHGIAVRAKASAGKIVCRRAP